MVFPPQGNIIKLPVSITFNAAEQQWRDLPLALTEFNAKTNRRIKADLSNMIQARFIVNVETAGFSTSTLAVQYSTDQVSWFFLDGSSGPSVPANTTGLKISSFIDIVQVAKTDVFLRVIGRGGNGIIDPAFGTIVLDII